MGQMSDMLRSTAGEVSPQVGAGGLMAPFLMSLDRLALKANIPAGLSPYVLMAIVHERRNLGHQVREPIRVRAHPDWPGGWLIVDGRHRFLASVIAGCPDVLCVEVP